MSPVGLCAFCFTQFSPKDSGKPISKRIRFLHTRFTGPELPADTKSYRSCCDKRGAVLGAAAAAELAGRPNTRASVVLGRQSVLRHCKNEVDKLLGLSDIHN